jgi:sugar-specific transcriptional regulator TrmB
MTEIRNTKLISDLTELGLSAESSRIYTYLLEVGTDKTKNTAYDISKSLKIPRSTVYLSIERLSAKKLVDSYKINNILHFIAEHPNRIQKDIDEKQNLFQGILPLLEDLRKGGNTYYAVRTYTGKDGVKFVFDEMFDKTEIKDLKNIYSISSTNLSDILPNGFPEKLDRLKKKHGVFTKMIAVASSVEADKLEYVYKSDSNRESRLLPPKYNFDGSLYIFRNKVAFFSLTDGEIYSVVVESKTISEMLKNFFMCTWELLGDSMV